MARHSPKVIDLADDEPDVITSLLQQPFNKRSKTEKLNIVKVGRPVPFLDIFLMPGKRGRNDPENTYYMLDYNTGLYDHFVWLAGSKDTKKLYCWPCLLICKENERKSIWVEGAHFNDLASLAEAAITHHENKNHLENLCKLTEFCDEACDLMAENFRRLYPSFARQGSSNQKAIMNRRLLKQLIKVAILVYTLDMSVEYLATDWLTSEKFQKLFDLVTEQNKDLIKHCHEMGDNFIKMIRTFFRDFLECVQIEIQGLGYREIVLSKPEPLCSVQIDSVRDIDAGKTLLSSVMLRYVNNDGIVQQRFFGFEVNNTKSAAMVSKNVEVAMVRYRHNTVSQSYDGACVFVDELASLKKKIQITAPSAVLIPSIDHHLNQVLLQGLYGMRGVQVFVAIIENLVQKPKQLEVISDLINSCSCVTESPWNLNSNLLTYLLKEREFIISAFEQPLSTACLSMDMCGMIGHLVRELKEVKFMFLLFAFNNIFEITDELSDVVRTQLSDVNKCSDMVKSSIIKLRLLKSEGKAQEYIKEAKKCIPPDSINENTSSFITLLDLIIENIIIQIQSRFGNLKQFEFLQLIDSEKFVTYNVTFPERALISLKNLYGKHFEIKPLERELKYIYADLSFCFLSVVDIIKLIQDKNMRDGLAQAYKLFCLAATLPITAVEGCTCLQQIHSFIDDAKKHRVERYVNHRSLPTIGMSTILIREAQVLIEKSLVLELTAQKEFQDALINQYIDQKKEMGENFDCSE